MASRCEPAPLSKEALEGAVLIEGVPFCGPITQFDTTTATRQPNGGVTLVTTRTKLSEREAGPEFSADAFPRYLEPPH